MGRTAPAVTGGGSPAGTVLESGSELSVLFERGTILKKGSSEGRAGEMEMGMSAVDLVLVMSRESLCEWARVSLEERKERESVAFVLALGVYRDIS